MPIELYVGPQGSGKSYCMVKEAILPALADERWEVLSNLDVTHPKSGRRTVNVTTPPAHMVVDFELLARRIDENLSGPKEQIRNLLIAIDEVGLAMPQELHRSPAVMSVISIVLQLRKARCDFVGTVQHFERALKVMRDNANLVHECRLFYRTWLWWRRDVYGPLNRRTGRPYKMPWLFEVETVTPDVIHLSPDSPLRRRRSQGFRKVKFDGVTAAAYDTYQRQAGVSLGAGEAGATPSLAVVEGMIEDAVEEATDAATRRIDVERDERTRASASVPRRAGGAPARGAGGGRGRWQ